MDQLPRKQLDGVDLPTKSTFDAGEEQINGWITALQRLIKGKVRVKEEVSSRVSLDAPSSPLIPM